MGPGLVLALLALLAAPAAAEVVDGDAADAASLEELAQSVENPLADIASLPIEWVWEHGAGPEDGDRFALELVPQIPFALGEHWLLISRSIVPLLVHQQALVEGESSATGLGDIETSLFLEPRDTWLGAAWGLGPILRFPTATDEALGARAWSAGPTAAVAAEHGAWSGGAIAHQLWSYAERDDGRVRETLIDPWLNHAWASGFSITLEGEARYDWEAEEWTVPVGAVLHQLVEIGGQPIDLGLQVLHFVERTPDDPTWSVSFTVDLLFERSRPRGVEAR